MRLRRFEIENYRGITRIALDFGASTILIGENGSGKSTVLDALAVCLGAGPTSSSFGLRPRDLRPAPDGTILPVRMRLTLEGENPPQGFAVDFPGRDFRALTLSVEAGPDQADELLAARWSVADASGQILSSDDADVLRRLREQSPLFLIRGGLMLHTPSPEPGPTEDDEAARPAELSVTDLASEIDRSYRRLVSDTAQLSRKELDRGFEAVREMLSRSAKNVVAESRGSGRFLEDLLGQQGRHALDRPFDRLKFHGAGAQRVGMLLFLGSFLHSRHSPVAPGAEPILAIENPEAHLHPLTVAAVWDLLDRIPWQKVLSSHSGQILAAAPLTSVRRLERLDGVVEVRQVRPGALRAEDMRRISYHVRARRGAAFFSRCWLLMEGETEFWIVPELARLLGFDLDVEGIACVEFAQCGIDPLVRVADELGIEWHLLTDGDEAGAHYAERVRRLAGGVPLDRRLTRLAQRDIEHCLWRHGYARVYEAIGGAEPSRPTRSPHQAATAVRNVIGRAIKRTSKPFLALSVVDAMDDPGAPGVPPVLRTMIETAVTLARGQLT